MSGRRRLNIVIDGECRRVLEVVFHAIRNEPEGRVGSVSLHMEDGDRVKCGWLELADGTVEVHEEC
jgi:hypothetical protein